MKIINRKQIARIIILTASIFILMLSCGRKSTVDNEVKLAYIPYSADLPFFVAMDNAMFEKKGLKIEPIKCSSSSEALDLVLAGKADGAMGNSFSVLFSIQAKNPEKIRLINVSAETKENNSFTGFILVANDSKIKSVNELIGKTVGTGKGASQLLWAKLFFQNLGWDPKKDVNIEQESPESLLNALNSGQFDAIFVYEPYATVGITKEIAKPLLPFFRESIINPFPAGGATLSTEFINKNPTAAKLVIEALDQAIELINSNPNLAKKSLINFTPLDKEKALYSQIYFWWGSKEMKVEPIQKLADIIFENGLLNKKIDTKEMIK